MPSKPFVLLVEDSEDDAFFFRWTLQKCCVGCDLVHLADGVAAIEHLKAVEAGAKQRPDIVFLDLKLPTFSGFEVLMWLRENPLREPLRVFVLSGSEHSNDLGRAESLGAAGYFVKPISSAQLSAKLEEVQPSSPVSTA